MDIVIYVYDNTGIAYTRKLKVNTQSPDKALAVGIRLARKKWRELGKDCSEYGWTYTVSIP